MNTDLNRKNYSVAEGGITLLTGVLGLLVLSAVIGAISSNVTVGVVGNFFLGVAIQAAMLLAAVLPPVFMKSRPTYTVRKISVRTGFVSALICIMCLVGFEGIALLFNGALYVSGYNGGVAVDVTSPLAIVLTVIRVVIFAPIVEELFFRRSIMSSLSIFPFAKDKSRVAFTVAFSGLIFSLYHMNPMQTVYQFFLGCVIAYTVLTFGSVVTGIIIHALNNALALVLSLTPLDALLQRAVGMAFTGAVGFIVVLLVSAVLAVGMGLLIYLVCKKFGGAPALPEIVTDGAHETSPDTADGVKFVNFERREKNLVAGIMYGVGVAVCLLVWVLTLIAGYSVNA